MVSELVNKTKILLRRKTRRRRHTWALDNACHVQDVFLISGDSDSLRRFGLQLLDFAYEATESGGVDALSRHVR